MSGAGNAGEEQEQEQEQERHRKEEEKHWKDVARTFLWYREFVVDDLKQRQQHLNHLSDRHASLLPSSTFEKIEAVAHAALGNQDMLTDLVMHYSQEYGVPMPEKRVGDPISPERQHRNEAVLHSLYREWTLEAKEERDATFAPLLAALQRHLPVSSPELAYRQRVLVPGCGAGRLPAEVAVLGYAAEGNEFSAYMLMASNFILNGVDKPNVYTFYPFLERVSNVVGANDPLQGLSLPDSVAVEMMKNSPYYHLYVNGDQDSDEDPGDADAMSVAGEGEAQEQEEDGEKFELCCVCRDPKSTAKRWKNMPMRPPLGMSSGDFVAIYGEKELSNPAGSYDCVMTCFFIDTAPNVIEYIETIFYALRPGGVWINLGPLLYHWSKDQDYNGDERYNKSIELSYEEVRHVVKKVGFVFLEEDRVKCTYTRHRRSIMHTEFNALFFVAKKPSDQGKKSNKSNKSNKDMKDNDK